ncbi:MAG: uroporphyrinogen-III synthase [Bacteroidetes bacterium]|nr:MAG: uroporphyrinogen-III synthase [Bacteroidota bacterium]
MLANTTTVLCTKTLNPRTVEFARQKGIDIVCDDWIAIQPNTSADFYQQMPLLNKYLVFTSSAAAQVYAHYVANSNQIQPAKFVYCLAGDTMQVVGSIRNCKVVGTAKNAGALAQKIIDDNATHAVSFLASNIRREVLPTMLINAGITLQEITAYDTVPTPKNYKGNMEGYMFFSPSAVDSFFYSNTIPQQIPCFCIGTATANTVKALVKNEIQIAPFPSQQAIVETVINYFKTAFIC